MRGCIWAALWLLAFWLAILAWSGQEVFKALS